MLSCTYVVLQNLNHHDIYQHQKAMQNVLLFFAWYRNAVHWKMTKWNRKLNKNDRKQYNNFANQR